MQPTHLPLGLLESACLLLLLGGNLLLRRALIPHGPDDDRGLLGLVVVLVVRDVPAVLDIVVARVLVGEAALPRGSGGGRRYRRGGGLLGVLVGRCVCRQFQVSVRAYGAVKRHAGCGCSSEHEQAKQKQQRTPVASHGADWLG